MKHFLPHHEIERQWSVNDSWSCILGNMGGDRLQIVINEVLAAFIGKEEVTRSPPHHENKCQWSINNSWSCILGNLRGDTLHIVINYGLAAFIGKIECEMLPAPSSKWASMECQRLLAFYYHWLHCAVAVIVYIHGLTVSLHQTAHKYLVVALLMKWVVTVPEVMAGIFRTYPPIKAAIFLFMDACDQAPLILLKMQDPESLTLRWRSFSRWGRERFACLFCNKGGQYFVYDCIWPVTPPDYPRYMTNNCWHSIEAHFDDVVGHMCLFGLINNAANTLNMDCDVPMSIFYDQQWHIWMRPDMCNPICGTGDWNRPV